MQPRVFLCQFLKGLARFSVKNQQNPFLVKCKKSAFCVFQFEILCKFAQNSE